MDASVCLWPSPLDQGDKSDFSSFTQFWQRDGSQSLLVFSRRKKPMLFWMVRSSSKRKKFGFFQKTLRCKCGREPLGTISVRAWRKVSSPSLLTKPDSVNQRTQFPGRTCGGLSVLWCLPEIGSMPNQVPTLAVTH